MKKIEVIVPQVVVEVIKKRLKEIFGEDIKNGKRNEGYPGITIYEVEGRGLGHGDIHIWGGKKFEVNTFPKSKIEMVVLDEDVERIVENIIVVVNESELVADTKHKGKIFISTVDDCIRIRDRSRGEDAIN